MNTLEKNAPNWSRDEIIKELKIFKDIYKRRPIKDNLHGMRFPHMFATYFLLKKIKPSYVIESGIYKGQSTWLIEETLPNAKVLSIDIDLSNRKYISEKVNYSDIDFKHQDFSNIPEDTLVFFDDHVNHYQRLMQAKFFNIKNIIFEDNYNIDKGDFYSLKHVENYNGFNHNYSKKSLIKTFYIFFIEILKKFILKKYYIDNDKILFRLRDHVPNKNDFFNIRKNIEIYYEFPPIINNKNTDKKPILEDVNFELEVTKEELSGYNNITYLKLF